MKAMAVYTGKAGSIHLADLPEPGVDDVPNGRGVLVLTGLSGGDHTVKVPGDRIMLGFVLGNKVALGSVNANRVYFERGVMDMALAEAQYPGGWVVC
jgi:Glucose dehydrogenase C-terminus